jgi:hypothetical protein
VQVTRTFEAVLNNLGPGAAPGIVAAQGGERLPQIAGRQDAEFSAQPTARTAIVGNRDDCGEVVGDPSQGGQRRGQPVPATERDDAWADLEPGGRRTQIVERRRRRQTC